jgi:hypothetical protein
MEFLIIGIVTALNLIFVKKKFELKRYEDGIFDLFLLVVVTIIFGGSYGGLVVGMVSSLIISIYLFASPPKFVTPLVRSAVAKVKDEVKEAKKGSSSFPDWNGKL